MGLFGKKRLSVKELFSVASALFDDAEQTETWIAAVKELEGSASEKDLERELLNLRMFLVDLCIVSNFDGAVRDLLRDEVIIFVQGKNPDAGKEITARQASYGDAWMNNPFPDFPNSYSVVKKFSEICGFELSGPAEMMALTSLCSTLVSSVSKAFSEIQNMYKIVK